jgi:hypothetical protein
MNAKDAYTLASLFGSFGQRGVNPARDKLNQGVVDQAQAGIQNEIAKEQAKKGGVLGTVGRIAGTAAGFAIGGPAGAAAGSMIGGAGGDMADGNKINPGQVAMDGISGGVSGYGMQQASPVAPPLDSNMEAMAAPSLSGGTPGAQAAAVNAAAAPPTQGFGQKFFGGLSSQMGAPTQRKPGYYKMADGSYVYFQG